MSENPMKDVLNELFPYFERLETQSAAILQMLTDKGVVAPEDRERYLEQAGTASEIKWRAARVRMERLLEPSSKIAESGRRDDHKSAGSQSEQKKETPESLAQASGEPVSESDRPDAEKQERSNGRGSSKKEHAGSDPKPDTSDHPRPESEPVAKRHDSSKGDPKDSEKKNAA